MEHFDVHGVWWLPGTPKRRISGHLTFDGDGGHLTLHGSLIPLPDPVGDVINIPPPVLTTHEVVFGCTDEGRDATLRSVHGFAGPGLDDSVTESYSVQYVYLGCHADDDQWELTWFSFDALDVWADPSPINSPERAFGDFETVATTELPGGVLRLRSGSRGESTESKIELERVTWFELRPNTPIDSATILNDFVRPLRALLTVSFGRATRHTRWWVRPEGADERLDLAQGYYAAIAAPTKEWSELDALQYNVPTLLTARDPGIALDALLRNWFRVWAEHKDALVKLLAPYHAPFVYNEHRYAATYQALESFYRGSRQELPIDQHRARVKLVIDTLEGADVPPEIVGWVSRLVKDRNDRPLRELIAELLTALGEIGAEIRRAVPDFERIVTGGRTSVSHGGVRTPITSVSRYWYGEAMRWVARALLLREAGLKLEDIEHRVLGSEVFRHALEQLQAPAPEPNG